MRMSQLFLRTLRDSPAEANTPGLRFLLRAGFMQSVKRGSYVYLPLGARVRNKITELARRSMTSIGGQEVALPHEVQTDLPTVILVLAGSVIQSYRQLPVALFYIGESRNVEGEARESLVLESFSLHADAADLEVFYAQVEESFAQMLGRCKLSPLKVVAAEDERGEVTAHQFVWLWPGGDETIMVCNSCAYRAQQTVSRFRKTISPPEELAPMQDVETPNCKTIAELAEFLNIPQSRTAKAVFMVATVDQEDRFVFAVVRGDTDLNEVKLKRLLKASALSPATEAEIREIGSEPGYGSPVGLRDITVVVDDLIPQSPNLVAGANRPGFHTLNVNYGRDYQASIVADIALAREGDLCPRCGAPLRAEKAVTLATFERMGDRHSRTLDVVYLDRDGRAQPLTMGRYRLYLDRLLTAIAETHYDDYGIIWPSSITPYHVYLMMLGKRSEALSAAADRLYAELAAAGVDVLYDDRDERAGVKFNDADLLGLPWRVVVGERGLNEGTVEIKRRTDKDKQAVPMGDVVPVVCPHR